MGGGAGLGGPRDMNYFISRKFPFWGWRVDEQKRGLALTKSSAKRAAVNWIAKHAPPPAAKTYDDPFR